jgi:hypothetical protein
MTKKLVLVVHGIGEQMAGETLDGLVGAATGNKPRQVQSDVRWLRDEHAEMDRRSVDLFPCHIRRVRTEDSEVVFSEVFWADLSRGRVGRFATLYELILMVLGLGHIVRENAEELHPNGHWLRTLANSFVAALHGPIAVLNVLLVVGALLLYGLFQVGRVDPAAIHLTILIMGALAAVAGYKLGQRTKSYLLGIFATWLLWLGLALALFVVVTFQFDPWTALKSSDEVIRWYAFWLVMVLDVLWLIAIVSLLVIFVGAALVEPAQRGDSRSIYPILCALMTILWMVVVSILWVSLAKLLENVIITPGLLKAGIGLLPIIWLCLLVIAVVVTIVWFRRRRWADRHDTSNYTADPVPRLILSDWIRWAIVFATLLLALGALSMSYTNLRGQDNLAWLTDWGYGLALTIAALVGVGYLLVWSKLAVGLGIAKDVITYFNGDPGARNSTRPEFPARARMHMRFVTVMETMIASEKPEEVVVIAHSQGTVIAVRAIVMEIEAIRRKQTSLLFDTKSIGKRTLVTMGSPCSHLYEHYFPSKFPLPTDFDQRLDRWINIFRVDDFVGTLVGDLNGDWPKNIAVNPKGHTGYWTDDDVREELCKAVLPELA